MSRVVEVVFYIHGVSPKPRASLHTSNYRTLHEGITRLDKVVKPSWPSYWSGAEWGFNYDDGVMRSHKALAQAQRILGARTMALVDHEREPGVPFSRLVLRKFRKLLFFGFADMFYYVSKDGKWAIRYEVAWQLRDYINQRTGGDSETEVSLTLVAHSAGAVIALDFLYYIFNPNVTKWLKQGDSAFAKDKRQEGGAQALERGLKELREFAKDGRLRLRRLFTFGAPVTFLMLRNDTVVETFAQDGALIPENFGMASTLRTHQITGPRWINIWDKDDVIAWPVASLIQDEEVVKDVNVNVGLFPGGAHTNYWADKDCHRVIAEHW